ncbi:hypothetical protein FB45DRAFT_1092887 [Roridomyces roridus]|uniref:Uncharacterized protein n=1 Tax=Roridomyces roridus TaxID=1738132 RepID=A0AAD7BHY8_9AGAR|nr:hypothetical protein FB45DRAFT_1092887 [Roridomyces roridus]
MSLSGTLICSNILAPVSSTRPQTFPATCAVLRQTLQTLRHPISPAIQYDGILCHIHTLTFNARLQKDPEISLVQGLKDSEGQWTLGCVPKDDSDRARGVCLNADVALALENETDHRLQNILKLLLSVTLINELTHLLKNHFLPHPNGAENYVEAEAGWSLEKALLGGHIRVTWESVTEIGVVEKIARLSLVPDRENEERLIVDSDMEAYLAALDSACILKLFDLELTRVGQGVPSMVTTRGSSPNDWTRWPPRMKLEPGQVWTLVGANRAPFTEGVMG